MPTDDLRGSAPAMSTKDLLLEVYKDMKFVRPAVEGLLAAGVVARIEALERDDATAKAAGVNDDLVKRVAALEKQNEEDLAAGRERRRIGDLTNRTIAAVVLVSNFVLGAIVMFVSLIQSNHPV